MRLFYDPNISGSNDSHTLNEEESKHAVRVLRMTNGDKLAVLNGKGDRFECQITDAHPKKCELKISAHHTEKQLAHAIHIAVSPTKQMERMEWFVEKATEIGVTQITFLQCTNSERVKLKLDRLERKAISAMKQSHRLYLPKLNDLTDYSKFVKANPRGLIAHCYDGQKNTIANVFEPQKCPILIGPEGDFSMEEVALADENGYKIIKM